jgi:hypothetical protein
MIASNTAGPAAEATRDRHPVPQHLARRARGGSGMSARFASRVGRASRLRSGAHRAGQRVQTHISSIFGKLGVHRCSNVVAGALGVGLLSCNRPARSWSRSANAPSNRACWHGVRAVATRVAVIVGPEPSLATVVLGFGCYPLVNGLLALVRRGSNGQSKPSGASLPSCPRVLAVPTLVPAELSAGQPVSRYPGHLTRSGRLLVE